jgi:hypothetical protein
MLEPLTMRNEPSGAALLAVARDVLTRDIAPTLSGRPRYLAAMVANAIGIVAREIENGHAMDEAWARACSRAGFDADAADLAAFIRAGRHDGDAALHAMLLDSATRAADIWKPPSSAT